MASRHYTSTTSQPALPLADTTPPPGPVTDDGRRLAALRDKAAREREHWATVRANRPTLHIPTEGYWGRRSALGEIGG